MSKRERLCLCLLAAFLMTTAASFSRGQDGDFVRGMNAVAVNEMAKPKVADWHVFLVAVKDYNEDISPVRYTDADVQALYNRFVSLNVPPENITILSKTQTAHNYYPEKSNILAQFRKFLSQLDSKSIAFVYFSGHGFNEKVDGKEKSFFAPIDFDRSSPKHSEMAICLNDDILAELAASAAPFSWLCVDACCSYIGTRGDMDSGLQFSMSNIPEDVLFQQSCADGEPAYEGVNPTVVQRKKLGIDPTNPDFQHGLFTKSLLEALDVENPRAVQNVDGIVTLSEVLGYVERNVNEDAMKYHNRRQTPRHKVSDAKNIDDFILLPEVYINGYPPVVWRKGRSLAEEARVLLNRGKCEEAVETIQKAREILPTEFADDEVNALYELAKAAWKEGSNEYALATVEEALEIDGENSKCLRLQSAILKANPKLVVGGATRSSDSSSSSGNIGNSGRAKPSEPGLRKPGDVMTVEIAGVETRFRWCPEGKFMMGSPSTENGHDAGEAQHEVIIPCGFWLAENETTQKLWNAVMGKENNHSDHQGDNNPVERVSWEDSQDFIGKIQEHAPKGMKFKLPSEEHWEYACRAGTTTAYSFGDKWEPSQANIGFQTQRVGSYKENAWGLKDMHGNVWEWCDGRYEDHYVFRGGGCPCVPESCRSAYRAGHQAVLMFYLSLGFRLELIEENE